MQKLKNLSISKIWKKVIWYWCLIVCHMGLLSYMALWHCREKKIRAVLRKRLSTVFQNVKLMMIPVWRSLLELSCIAVKTSVGIQEYECPKTCYKSNKHKVLYHFYSGPDLKNAFRCKMAIVQETIGFAWESWLEMIAISEHCFSLLLKYLQYD